jgi:hypothetical protein
MEEWENKEWKNGRMEGWRITCVVSYLCYNVGNDGSHVNYKEMDHADKYGVR